MRVAAVDLGSNTFILFIAEVEQGKIVKVDHDEVKMVRLGQGVNASRKLHPDALARANVALASFAQTISKFHVTQVRACATSAARDVENGGELLKLGEKYGVPIEIISGEKEAELTYRGAIGSLHEPVVVIDVGGGSTEIIFGDQSGIQFRRSLDIGAVRLTEMFITAHPVAALEREQMERFISEKITTSVAAQSGSRKIIAVAGTPTTLATLDQGLGYESAQVDGYLLPVVRIQYWVDRLATMTVAERQKLAGMDAKRADVIVAGASILLRVALALGADEVEVSIRGLRYGLAQMMGEEKVHV